MIMTTKEAEALLANFAKIAGYSKKTRGAPEYWRPNKLGQRVESVRLARDEDGLFHYRFKKAE